MYGYMKWSALNLGLLLRKNIYVNYNAIEKEL